MVVADEYSALIKLYHVLGGLYIWEFFTTLDYEWSVIRGRRPYRWTIWIYSFTRVTTLMAVILTLTGLDTATPINCQLWIIFIFIFGYLSLSAALLLIVLRTIAIWNKRKIVIVLTMGIWVVYLAFIVETISRLRSSWSDRLHGFGCKLPDMEHDKFALIILFTADLVLSWRRHVWNGMPPLAAGCYLDLVRRRSRSYCSDIHLFGPEPHPQLHVCDARADINVNHRNANIHLSYGLWLLSRYHDGLGP